jgi:putative adhesin
MKRPIIIALLVVALLFVLAGIGAVVFFTANGGFRTNNPFDRRNISSQLEESKTLKVDAGKPVSLTVADDAGGITVTGADVETVQVKVIKTAYDSTQARADEEVKTVKYKVEQTGNTITLKYELPKSMNFSNNVNTVDFIVTVPNETTVDVNTSFGDVNVADIKGDADIVTTFGEVTVENVEGGLSISNSNGDMNASSIDSGNKDISLNSEFGGLTLKSANGKNVTLESNSGTITLRDVRATNGITTQTDFGNITIENGASDTLSTKSSNGAVSLIKVKVNKDIRVENEFGEIELEQAFAASYDLHTNGGSITVDGAKGKLKAESEFGGIKIENAESVTLDVKTNNGTVEFSGSLAEGPHTVNSEFGEIDLTLPDDSKLNVDLSTEFGTIKSDLPILVMVNQTSNSNGDQIVGSINGGGEQLTVETNNGSVNIHAGK